MRCVSYKLLPAQHRERILTLALKEEKNGFWGFLVNCYKDIWRRQWHPTPVLLPGKSHGRGSLVGCSPWDSRTVGHDSETSLSLFTFLHWRRKWQPTPVFLPGESPGRGSLVGCRLWGHTESDTTEVT